MFDDARFQKLVEEDRPTGEVIAVDRFLVQVKGLESVTAGALVLFENGFQGMVREVRADGVTILNLSAEDTPIGSLVTLEDDIMSIGVGEAMIGRVISAMGKPIDGKGPMRLTASRPVFNSAPGVIERSQVKDALPTGVAMVDFLFPVVLGQRIAVLGDSKSGKSTFLSQLTVSQLNTNRLVIYCMISKRKVDVDALLTKLQSTGAISHTIVIVANVFEALPQSYLAPYAACAMAEYFWQEQGRDCIIIYDDLTSHAKVYREISLMGRGNPGRDSYPGDMFYAHSSLLERAGKIASNGATLSALPVVLTPSDDITAYLSTSIMSITDGQIVLDLETFRQGIRPAVNVGLSVSRVGGRGLNDRQKKIMDTLFKKIAAYHQAAEFSRFGSELALDAQADLELGKRIYEVFKQPPDHIYSIMEQEMFLSTVLKTEGKIKINVDSMKRQAGELAKNAKSDTDLAVAIDKLLADNTIQQAQT
ncbi:MAG TPA: sodium-transporting two-sector ATPase [Candidatus Nanoarchaeia archaeon]|nr:sodium-transporting two-sector ATPase [Candidatus Nanoarchaeia archaeon]